jgi:microcystin-dependent protein
LAIKHKRQATRPPTPDPDAIQSADWNDDHEIEGAIGELSELAAQPNTLLFLNDDAKGALVPLSALARDIIALALERDILNRLGALAKSGDTMSGALDMDGNRITGLAAPVTSTDAVTKEYADALISAVSGALAFKGEWDASVGTFPGAGAVKVGWFYKVSVAGTVGGKFFSVGDDVFAVVDNPSTTVYAANWLKIEGSITLAEVEAAVGFSFGTGAALNAGTSVGNLVQVQTGGKLPALDGSLLTNLPGGFSGAYADLSGKPTLGTAAAKNVGTTSGDVVEVQTGGKLPALDGSNLTNLPSGATVGGIQFFLSNTAPAGWLKANGALLSRTTYAALYAYAAASGNIVAEASWSANKGAFSTGDTSTTFRIPDLRGIFIRGWDDSAGVDSGRAIGSSQADDNKAHTHTVSGLLTATNSVQLDTSGSGQPYTANDTKTSSSSGGTEARPKNVALLACIKY